MKRLAVSLLFVLAGCGPAASGTTSATASRSAAHPTEVRDLGVSGNLLGVLQGQ